MWQRRGPWAGNDSGQKPTLTFDTGLQSRTVCTVKYCCLFLETQTSNSPFTHLTACVKISCQCEICFLFESAVKTLPFLSQGWAISICRLYPKNRHNVIHFLETQLQTVNGQNNRIFFLCKLSEIKMRHYIDATILLMQISDIKVTDTRVKTVSVYRCICLMVLNHHISHVVKTPIFHSF